MSQNGHTHFKDLEKLYARYNAAKILKYVFPFLLLCIKGLNIDWPIKCHCCPHIETSQLICTANQLTGF